MDGTELFEACVDDRVVDTAAIIDDRARGRGGGGNRVSASRDGSQSAEAFLRSLRTRAWRQSRPKTPDFPDRNPVVEDPDVGDPEVEGGEVGSPEIGVAARSEATSGGVDGPPVGADGALPVEEDGEDEEDEDEAEDEEEEPGSVSVSSASVISSSSALPASVS